MICPVCGSGNCYHFYNDGPYEIRRCPDCTFAFIWPMPSGQELESKFQHDYIRDEDRVVARFEQHRRDALDAIAQVVRSHCSGGRLLDVGTAGGAFLLRFLDDPAWEVHGLEPSKVAASYGRQKYGLSIHQGFLKDAHFEPGSFDVLTMLDTLCLMTEIGRAHV